MVDVPPTQRRDILLPGTVDKQKESILQLAEKRHIDPTLLEDVLAGVESLGDDADLPFNGTCRVCSISTLPLHRWWWLLMMKGSTMKALTSLRVRVERRRISSATGGGGHVVLVGQGGAAR